MNLFAKSVLYVAVAVAVCVPASLASAQEGPSAARKAQNKLLAQRAARVDAIRKLAERIKGLQITSETTVQDFVTENDTIQTALNAWLNGMKETKVQYNDDGTCEVTMEVTLATVTTTLKEIHNRYYKGDKFKGQDFSEITQHTELKVLKEVGNGAPRAEWVGEEEFRPVPKDENPTSASFMSRRAAAWWKANVKPQGRLMALRGARVDGMRKLVERIFGSQISSQTLVQDFVTERDEIGALSQALLRGARETAVKYHDDEPIVEVEMSVTLETVTTTVKQFAETHWKGDKVKMKRFEEAVQKTDRKVLSETGMSVVAPRFMIGEVDEEFIETTKATGTWPPAISATGSAAIDTENENAAQAKLMAIRGAELDARRKLAEQIDGLIIRSNTTVKDFVTESDEIRTAMMTFQQGAYVVEGSQKVLQDGTVEVTVAIETAPLWDIVSHYSKKVVTKTEKVAPAADESEE